MTIPRFNLEFLKTSKPIENHVTKFGGQPTWLTEPEWPLSRGTNDPMRFICQIAFSDLALDEPYDKGMAYLFMSDSETLIDGELYGAYDQFDPEGGENAVILQPGTERLVDTSPLTKGPSLLPKKAMYGFGDQVAAWAQANEYEEYAVQLLSANDPAFVSIDDLAEFPDSQRQQYREKLSGNKLAGVPGFIQPDEFPFSLGTSQLLLQLDSGKTPFYVDFGDVGVGYLFVEKGSGRARFLWQCG